MEIINLLALIVIVIAIVKILLLLIHSKPLISIGKCMARNPKLTSFVFFILSGIILYYLVSAGMTIIQIFAVTLFVSFMIAIGLAPYYKGVLKEFEADMKKGIFWKKIGFYILLWTLLIVWGIIALFS